MNSRDLGDVDVVVEEADYTETKTFYHTSEFWIAVIGIFGILLAAYSDGGDSISREDGWRYASILAGTYIVSRGLAKAGTREPTDDR